MLDKIEQKNQVSTVRCVPGGGRGSGRFSAVAQPMELNSRLPSTALAVS
jgi:hypothetical protein